MELAQVLIGYHFANEALLQQALRVAGAPRALREGNKPLANVGDTVIHTVISVDCYHEGLTIGATTQRIQTLANNARFAQLCDNSGLAGCIFNNPAQFNMVSDKTKATTLEAVVGAVFIDAGIRGFQEARRAMLALGIIQRCRITLNSFCAMGGETGDPRAAGSGKLTAGVLEKYL
ncbi:ribonuclease III domain-containing protein [Xylariaceae sp. FL1272]|nr:ribonuclease III domain-containing protein [Xylariaceae sp. FL1272]